MPSWSDSLQQDHRWSGRQLIGVGYGAQDGSDSDVPIPSSHLNSEPQDVQTNIKKRILIASDVSSSGTDENASELEGENGFDCSLNPSPALSLGSQWQPVFSQELMTKRILLAAEEIDDSDGDFQDQEEELLMDFRLGEQSNAMQQLAITTSNLDVMDVEDTAIAVSQGDDMAHHRDIDVEMRSALSARETSDETGQQQARSTMSPMAVDNSRIQESQGVEMKPASNRADALRRKKKAIKYLERICLDMLKQLPEFLDLELKSAREDLVTSDSEEESDIAGHQQNVDKESARIIKTTEEAKVGEIYIPLLNRTSGDLKYLKYPRKPAQSETSTSLPIARLLRVCTLLHEALVENAIVTKRDLYYKDINLFGKQSVVDALVDDIVASVGLKRSDFNVVASPKGLMAASALVLFVNGKRQQIGPVPTLIPSDAQIDEVDISRPPCWVLVIEKEATFTTLCASGILADQELGEGVLVTGKGYPDFATLHFLRLLADEFSDCPIAILVDADPHGLDILSVYQYGSKGMRLTTEANGLPLRERAAWIGVKATEWATLSMDMDKLIPISEKDERFNLAHQAQSMLREEDLPVGWRRQLAHMLHSRRKAEIQNVNNANAESGSFAPHLDDAESKKPAVPQPAVSPTSTDGALTESVSNMTSRTPASLSAGEKQKVPGSKSIPFPADAPVLPVTSESCPERRGLYGYVKPRIMQLLSSSS